MGLPTYAHGSHFMTHDPLTHCQLWRRYGLIRPLHSTLKNVMALHRRIVETAHSPRWRPLAVDVYKYGLFCRPWGWQAAIIS